MKKEMRNVMALGASVALVALTGCGAIAGAEGEEENEENNGESVEDVPALSEIDSQMWDSMQEAGTVTMTADVNEFLAEEDPQTAQMFEQMMGGENSEIQFFGSLDETATGMRFGDEELLRNLGDGEVYISADAIFNLLDGQSLGLSPEEQQQLDDAAAEFSDSWFDYSEEIQAEGDVEEIDLSVLFNDLQQSWKGEEADLDSPVEREQISDEGTHEVRDEQDVWVYTGDEEGLELVLEANHDSPKFVSLSSDDASVKFSDWGDTELPEQPEESQIMTEQDIEQQMSGAGGSSSSSDNNIESTEPDTEPSEPSSNSEPDTESTESSSDSESGLDSTYSGSDIARVPGVGMFNCEGPIPGDPGFTDPNGNYTDSDIQEIQEACDATG